MSAMLPMARRPLLVGQITGQEQVEMKFRTIAAMIPLILIAGTALQAQSASSDAAPKPAVKEKKICRTEDDTGSIVPKRTCHTKAEWDAIYAEQQNQVNTDAFRSNQRH